MSLNDQDDQNFAEKPVELDLLFFIQVKLFYQVKVF